MTVFCREVYDVLVKDGTIVPKPEKNPPTVPMDYSWAQVSEKTDQHKVLVFIKSLVYRHSFTERARAEMSLRFSRNFSVARVFKTAFYCDVVLCFPGTWID